MLILSNLQHPPRSGLAERESKKNPERASRRLTRSMSRRAEPSPPKEADVELSLEEELLEVSEVVDLIMKKGSFLQCYRSV